MKSARYSWTMAVAGIVGAFASMTEARAEEFEEGGKLYAIQNRKYVSQHEFGILVGVVPLDAFYKGVTGNVSYTFHFDDVWAWEIASASYSLNIDTDLKRQLQDDFAVSPTKFPALTWFAGSNVILKPLYGKLAFLNSSLVYHELFLTGGLGASEFENAGVFLGVNLGFGIRTYLSRAFSFRLEFRDYLYTPAEAPFSETKNVMLIQGGFALNIH